MRRAAASPNVFGAAFMVTAMSAFAISDAIFKGLSEYLPLFQAIALRGLFVSVMLVMIVIARGEISFRPNPRDRKFLAFRTIGEILGASCFLGALYMMPLANASAILQSVPLVITLVAAFVLGERVGWRRYLAIIVGFVGVLIVIRPGTEGFNIYSLLVLAAVMLFVLRDLGTRLISQECSSFYTSLVTAVVMTVFSGTIALIRGLEPVAPKAWFLLLLGAIAMIGAYHFSVMAMRSGDVAAVSPFRYTLLLWAMVLGWGFYGEVPDLPMLLGAVLIVASGLFTLYRARRRGGQRAVLRGDADDTQDSNR